MSSFFPDLGYAHHQVVGDLPLDVEVPGLNVRGPPRIRWNVNDPAVPVLPTRGKGPRSRKDVRDAIVDLGGSAVSRGNSLAVEKSQSILIGERAFLKCFVIDAISAANHGFAVDAVSKSQPRAECLVIDVLWTLPPVSSCARSEIGVSPKDISGIGVGESGIHHGEATKCLRSRQVDIVTNTVVQCEFGAEPVCILRVQGEILVPNPAEISVVQRGGIRKAEERTGDGIAPKARSPACTAGLGGSKI